MACCDIDGLMNGLNMDRKLIEGHIFMDSSTYGLKQSYLTP